MKFYEVLKFFGPFISLFSSFISCDGVRLSPLGMAATS